MASSLVGFLLLFGLLLTSSSSAQTDRFIPGRDSSGIGSAKVHRFSGYFTTSLFTLPDSGELVEMAYQLFELNRGYYRMSEPRKDLKLNKILEHENGALVSFTQVYKNVPLMYSSIRVWFNRVHKIKEIEGDFVYVINLPTIPEIDSATAVAIALQDLDFPPRAKVGGPNGPIIAASNEYLPFRPEGMHLVYVVEVVPDSLNRYAPFWRYYINALDGSILYKLQSTTWRD